MDETLKRLLDAEQRAQQRVEQARQEKEAAIRQALHDARTNEDKFTARVPEIHQAFLSKATERAEQTIGELQRRYDERNRELHDLSEQHKEDAVQAVFDLVTGRVPSA